MGTNDYYPGKYPKTSPAQSYKPVHGGYPTAEKLPTHAERVAARQAINGQPNGYHPVTEAELIRDRSLEKLSAAADEGRCEPKIATMGKTPATTPDNPIPGSGWRSDSEWPMVMTEAIDSVRLLQAIQQHIAELNNSAAKLAWALGAYRVDANKLPQLQAAYADALTPELQTRMHVEELANTLIGIASRV